MQPGRYLPGARRREGWNLGQRKTLVLWVVLIVIFLAIWQFLEPSGTTSHIHRSAPRSAQDSSTFKSQVITFGLLAIGMGWALWFRRRLGRFNAESAVVLKLFNGADYAAAAGGFAELLRKYPRPRALRATASHNLAMALLRNGELDQALETLASIDPWLLRYLPALRPTVAIELAGIYALRGDPAAADLWTEEAIARAKRVKPPRSIDPRVAFVRTVNALRRDEPEEAALTLDAAWADLEGTLVTVELRSFRVLRAFVATRRGIPARAGGDSSTAVLAEARTGELAWMGAEWPEMRAFLDGRAA